MAGVSPRLIVAFPAGNMGIAVWFDALPAPVELSVEGDVSGVERVERVERPGVMRGVSALLASEAPVLRVHRALLGSVRTLRDVGRDAEVPAWLGNDAGLYLGTVVVRTVPGARWEIWPNGQPVVRLDSGREIDVVEAGQAWAASGAPELSQLYAEVAEQ